MNTTYKYVSLNNDSLLNCKYTGIECIGGANIYIYDTVIVVRKESNSGKLYEFYSTNTFENLGSCINIGRAGNEMLKSRAPLWSDKIGDDRLIYFYEPGLRKMMTLNLTGSIKSGTPIFENSGVTPQNDMFKISKLNINEYLTEWHDYMEDKYYYSTCDSLGNIVSTSSYIYDISKIGLDNIYITSDIQCLSDDNQMYITAMMFFNQINLYNITYPEQSYSLCFDSIPNNVDNIIKKSMDKKMEYFQDIICENNYIIALWAGYSRKEWATLDRYSSIILIDNSINKGYKILLNEKLLSISINKNTKILYGLTFDSRIVTYDISKWMQ